MLIYFILDTFTFSDSILPKSLTFLNKVDCTLYSTYTMVWQPVGGEECEGDDEEGEGDEDEDEEDGTALPPPSLVVVVLNWQHRRRIRQKRRSKVVAAGWGTELILISCSTRDLSPG